MPDRAFPYRLVQLRKERGLSQYQLANLLGFSRGQISNYEQGTREPDYDTLKKIADFFNVSTDYLLGRTNDPRSLKEKVFDPTYEPTEVDLEELLKEANIRFMGERLATQDKEKLLQIARILWEERRKIKQEEGD
ncbi:MAG: helix-turn-helix domain-containing protein [Moorellaceae bacterium]